MTKTFFYYVDGEQIELEELKNRADQVPNPVYSHSCHRGCLCELKRAGKSVDISNREFKPDHIPRLFL